MIVVPPAAAILRVPLQYRALQQHNQTSGMLSKNSLEEKATLRSSKKRTGGFIT